MKITNYSAPEYQSIEILAQAAGEAFDEVSYLEAHLNETQQRLKQISRELAAQTRQAAGTTGALLSEPELVQAIELVAGSLAFGNAPWLPFGKPDRNKLFKLVGVAEDRLMAWEQVLRVMASLAFKQLEIKDYLLFEPRVEELLRTIRRIRAATQLSARSSEIARFASSNFLAFCENDGGPVPPEENGVLHQLIEQLLFRLSLALQQQNELEIHLNLCTFWAEQVVPRYDCSFQEWQFLIASLELGVHQKAGAQCSRILTPYFLTLNQSVTRFAFCGVYFRQAEELETKLAQALSEVRLDWRSFVRTVFGEILLEVGHPNAVSPLTWLVLNSNLFRGQDVTAFERAAAALVNLCRPLAERSWLDWLADDLAKIVGAMRYLADRREADGVIRNVVAFATENLKQGLEIFYSTPQFGKELTLVLDTAQVLALVNPSFQHAKSAFRTWFTSIFGADSGTSAWQHAKTIAGAVQTSIKYQTGASDFFTKYPSLSELLVAVPEFTAEARFPLQALGKVDSDLVENCPGNPANLEVLERTVRQALLNLLRHGTRRAPAVTLGWLLEDVFPTDSQTRLDDWETLFLSLRDEALMYRELQDEAVFEIITRITEEAPALALSERLWGVSDSLAAVIAPRVYAALPEYRGMTKETGLEKCARDNGTVLRRAALALELPFEDRSGFFETWWANLINSYIVNRPPRLFEANRQVIYDVVKEHFGETATELVDAVIGPVYGSAAVSEPDPGGVSPLLPLPVRFPGLADLQTRADLAVPAGSGVDWVMFLSTGVETAFHYATGTNAKLPKLLFNVAGGQPIPLVRETGDGEAGYLQHNLNYLCSILSEGFLPFEWCGFVAQDTVTAWGNLLEILPPTAPKIERFLIGLIYHTGTVSDGMTKLRLIDYLQALIELNRQWLAGHELHHQADALSQAVAAHLHRSFPDMVATGVSAASPEKCNRDLGQVYRALAEGMKKLPKPAARLHGHRFLLEAVSPYINYGEDLWRKTWRASWYHGEVIFSSLANRELKSWFSAFEKTGTTMTALSPLMRKFAGEPDPIFSPAPDEEREWRQTVGTLLALVQSNHCTPLEGPVLGWTLAESLPLAAAPDFISKLKVILDSLRNWFIDLDLSLVEAEFKAFEKASQEVQLLKKLVPQIETIRLKLAERIPAMQQLGSPQQINQLILFLTKDRFVAAPEGTRWALPRLLKGTDSRFLAQLAALSPVDMDRLQAGLSNLLAPHLGSAEFVAEILPIIKRMAQTEKDFQQAWNRQWNIEGKEFSDAACQRDMQWMARRICLDGWLGQPASRGSVPWYVAEVIPQAGSIPSKTYLRAIKLLVDQFQASNFLVPEMKNAAAEFQQAITPILQNPKKIDPETLEEVVEDKKSLWGVITGKLMRLGQD